MCSTHLEKGSISISTVEVCNYCTQRTNAQHASFVVLQIALVISDVFNLYDKFSHSLSLMHQIRFPLSHKAYLTMRMQITQSINFSILFCLHDLTHNLLAPTILFISKPRTTGLRFRQFTQFVSPENRLMLAVIRIYKSGVCSEASMDWTWFVFQYASSSSSLT